MGVSQDTIKRDRSLQAKVAEGERAQGELGALRYQACVVEGCTQGEYAEAVGVTQQAVAASIARYRATNPDLYNPVVQTGNARVDAQRQRREAERAAPEQPADEAVDMALAMAAQLGVLSAHLIERQRPSAATTNELKSAAQAAITHLQALLAYLEGN